MDERREYRIIQDGLPVASVSAPSVAAQREIAHYAMQCNQDGPLEIQQKIDGRWQRVARMPGATYCQRS